MATEKNKIDSGIEKVAKLTEHFGEEFTEHFKDYTKETENFVKEHPFLCLGIALGVGALLGAFVRK